MPAIYRAHEYLIFTVWQAIYVKTHSDQIKNHSTCKIKYRIRTSLTRNLQLVVCFLPALFAALCIKGILRPLSCGTTGSTQRNM